MDALALIGELEEKVAVAKLAPEYAATRPKEKFPEVLRPHRQVEVLGTWPLELQVLLGLLLPLFAHCRCHLCQLHVRSNFCHGFQTITLLFRALVSRLVLLFEHRVGANLWAPHQQLVDVLRRCGMRLHLPAEDGVPGGRHNMDTGPFVNGHDFPQILVVPSRVPKVVVIGKENPTILPEVRAGIPEASSQVLELRTPRILLQGP
mmetsp:Transcript_7324/g.16531  ORF Transcript_7324/g.16531 Transcript_7324/m.16531 type:complete len:205 (-) Transcript_7324:254-868(-)